MVRRRGMGNIRVSFARHVTASAIIFSTTRQSGRGRKTAPAVTVAFQAATSVISRLLLGRGQLVGIVARDAPEPAAAGDEALALVHLLDLADKTVFVLLFGLQEHRPEPLKRQAGPIILLVTASAHDSVIADQVALLANGISQRRLEKQRG